MTDHFDRQQNQRNAFYRAMAKRTDKRIRNGRAAFERMLVEGEAKFTALTSESQRTRDNKNKSKTPDNNNV
jgi:hypothetical protein